MDPFRSIHKVSRARIAAVACFLIGALSGRMALAEDLLGLYVGGAVGRAELRADGANFNPAGFKENAPTYKLMAGLRPISPVGIEVTYIDFGHPTGMLAGFPARVSMKGSAAFGVWYLPVPVVDIYLKAGLARLQSTVDGVTAGQTLCVTCTRSLFKVSRTNTSVAAGAGAQLKFGSWALRGEYEGFNAAGANSTLVSLGLTWTFL